MQNTKKNILLKNEFDRENPTGDMCIAVWTKISKNTQKYDKSLPATPMLCSRETTKHILPATPMLCSRETTKHIVQISGVLPDNMWQTTDNNHNIQGKQGKQV